MCIGLHTLPPCLLFCGNYILHESEYDVHIFCVALDIIIYLAPVKSPFPGERGQGDRDSKLEVCFKNRLFLQTESCDEMYVSPQLFLLLFCYRIARFDTDIPQLPTAEHALVTFYKNFSSFSVHKNKKILKNTGKVESNLL